MSAEGLTFIKRKNTLCIDLRSALGNVKPKPDQWADWITDVLKVEPANILLCSIHTVTGHLMVQLSEETVFQEKLTMLERGVPWGPEKIVFGWSSEEYLTTVKVHNYAPHMDIEAIKSIMGAYGKVISCVPGVHRRFKNASDGTLTFKMKLEAGKQPPSVLKSQVEGEVLSCYFEGGPRVCYKCGQSGHIGSYCRQRSAKPQPQAEDVAATPSWAALVASNSYKPATAEVKKSSKKKNTDSSSPPEEPLMHHDGLPYPGQSLKDKRGRSSSTSSAEDNQRNKSPREESPRDDQTEPDISQSPKLVPSATWGTQQNRSSLDYSSDNASKDKSDLANAKAESRIKELF